jgi:hypothetical protein
VFEKSLPSINYRVNPYSKQKQVRTGYVLDEVLAPNLPNDAAALLP